jgi:hypothetical protein
MKKPLKLLPFILLASIFAVWMTTAGMTGQASLEAEFAKAEQRLADGTGTQITVQSEGQDRIRTGRRASYKWCYKFEYQADGYSVPFTEKRWCERSQTSEPVSATLVYREDFPQIHYWVRSDATEEMYYGTSIQLWSGWASGAAALGLSGFAVISAVVNRKRKTPSAEANGVS